MQPDKFNLIWIDLEMTGLNPSSDAIIEIATLVTDKNLALIAQGPEFVIRQPPEVLAGMDKWNTEHHTASGLFDKVLASNTNYAEAETGTLQFLKQHAVKKASPMCGNSICQDRRFLARLMPELESFFHYRNLDVSTIKELAMRWAPEIFECMEKRESRHRALDDVKGSIKELQYYRDHFIGSS